MVSIIKDTSNIIAQALLDIDFLDLPSDEEYTYKGSIDGLSEIPKDASIYDVYSLSGDPYFYVRKDDLVIYRFNGSHVTLNNRTKKMSNVIKFFDIDILDIPSDKEYTYKGVVNDLSEIPKDANVCDLYTFIGDSFIYARKNDNTLYRIMNSPLDLINKTSDLPSDNDAKLDQGKPKLTLVPRQIIFDIAKVREYGVKKYKDPDNWKRVSVERYRDAAFRHFMAYLDDPYGVDEESGLPHLAHLACNIAFLCELQAEYGFYPEDTNE